MVMHSLTGERLDAELSRLPVPQHVPDRLKALAKQTGAPVTWHRRQALDEYLTRKGLPVPPKPKE